MTPHFTETRRSGEPDRKPPPSLRAEPQAQGKYGLARPTWD